ncbi:MAG: hypothetical protein ACLUE1_03605 [Adlercreutzia equolifaciens]
MLLNTKRALDDPRILGIDADGISAAVLGRPIPNTVFSRGHSRSRRP